MFRVGMRGRDGGRSGDNNGKSSGTVRKGDEGRRTMATMEMVM